MSATTELQRELSAGALRPVLGARMALKGRHLVVCLWVSLLFVYFNYVPLFPSEIWGHTQYGKWIIEHGRLPQAEPLMALAEGMRVVDTAWLSQVVFAQVESWGGAAFLSNLYALTLTATVLVFMRVFFLQSGRIAPTLGLSLLAFTMNWPRHAIIRPEIFGGLCFALLLWLVVRLDPWRYRSAVFSQEKDEPRHGIRWPIWIATPVLFAVWANLHASFAVGIVFLACHLLGRVIHVALSKGSLAAVLTDRLARHWLLLTELALAATLLNPYGLDLLIETVRLATTDVLPWQPLRLIDVEGVLFATAVVLMLILWRHSRQRIVPTDVLLLLSLAVALAAAVRMIGWFGYVLAFVLAPHVGNVWERIRSRMVSPGKASSSNSADEEETVLTPRHFTYSLLCLLVVWTAFALSPFSQPLLSAKPRNPAQLYSRSTPRGVSDFLRNYSPQGIVWAPRAWSDWILWDGPKGVQVFVTSSMHRAPRQAQLDYRRIARAESGWERSLDRYRIETLVVDKRIQRDLARAARQSVNWRVIYEDKLGLVLQRAG